MSPKQLETIILRENLKKGIPEYDHTKGYVNYALGEWLYDHRFNLPCKTYFHNVSEYSDWPCDTPEFYEWLGREDNWEMVGHNYFINYPDGFIVRHRFARPSYTQVLEWIEMEYEAKIDITGQYIKVDHLKIQSHDGDYLEESFRYKINKSYSYRELASITMHMIFDRIRLAGWHIPV